MMRGVRRGSTSEIRQQRPVPRAECRTCRTCRRKKVRCDGQHPKCGACCLRELVCEYPPDARKSTTRSKVQDVGALQKEIEGLRERLREGTQSHPTDAASSTANSRLRRILINSAGDSTLLASHEGNIDVQPATLERQRYKPPPVGHSSRLVSQHAAGQENDSWDAVDEGSSPQPEPNQDKEDFQVYGATSLLCDQSSHSFLLLRGRGSDVDESEKVVAQNQLVSLAAIRRQEEKIFCSTPSTMANVDFDGVPMDMAMHLIDLHWRHQHLTYLITYRPAVMDSIFKNGPYANKLLLNAIFLSSSLYSERIDSRVSNANRQLTRASFYERFKILLGQHIDQPSLPTVVALLIGGACLVSHGKQRAGWVYCGIGYRMLIDLGCHLDVPAGDQGKAVSKLTTVDVELRRRVFWGAYVGEKFQCLFLGRSPTLELSGINTSNEYLDTYEELEEWTPYVDHTLPAINQVPVYAGRPCFAISTFQSLLRLSHITSQIIHAFYSVNSWKSSSDTLIEAAVDIRNQLSQWKNSLPQHLQFDYSLQPTPPPHQLTPHTTYWTLVILVEQPFLNKNQFGDDTPEMRQHESKQRCIEAAQHVYKILQAYRTAFTLRRAQYGISYAAYCAVLALLQYTDESSDQYLQSIRFFWSALLEFQKGLSSGLKRPLKLLRSIMLRLRRDSQTLDDSFEDSRYSDTIRPCSQIYPDSDNGHPLNNSASAHPPTLETGFNPNSDPWYDLWPDVLTDGTDLLDDNMFGFFMQT